MGLIFKIAFRNLFRHFGKSLVIGTILFIGAMFMAVGNGIIAGTVNGIEENIIDRAIGDITLLSADQKDDNIMGPKPMKVIGNYAAVKAVLESQNYVKDFIPITRGVAVSLDVSMSVDMGDPGFSILYGTDFEKSQKMFDYPVVIVEGQMLQPGQRGILINESERKRIYEMNDIWLLPKDGSIIKANLPPNALDKIDTLRTRDDMVLMGMGDGYAASDIRLPILGIYKFRNLNRIFERLNLVDLESFRECFDYVTSADANTELSESSKDLLEMGEDELPDLFSEGNAIVEAETRPEDYSFDAVRKQVKVKEERNRNLDLDKGAFNVISVRVKKGADRYQAVEDLNNAFQKAGVDKFVRAVSWKDSFGYLADFILFFRLTLTVLVNFIFFVAIVVIINTLSMAAMERIYEIGMMRAVGAQRGFVGKVFFAETAILSMTFGTLGMLFGIVIVLFLASLQIKGTGPMVQMAFGGDMFHPMIDLKSFITGIIQLVIVTIIAMIYPIVLARRITPLDAINRE